MSKFQIITLAIFILCIIGGVVAFATYKGNTVNTSLPAVTIWGTYPVDVFDGYVANINSGLTQRITVNYRQYKVSEFQRNLISALARGQGPDAILVTADMLFPQEDKLLLVPYSMLSQRSYLDSYIQEASVYLKQGGISAIPFTVDPLVMYWNRDMFNSAGLAVYPKYWDEFTGLNEKLTVKDQNGNIRKAAMAMGDFGNITNAREILGTLMLQMGNPVTGYSNNFPVSTIAMNSDKTTVPAVQFFSQFANPSNSNYSWNKSMPNDKSAFLSGSLAVYFGFASELADIRNKNPNLNFDVAPLPQVRSGGKAATYGKMYGFSLLKSSANVDAAFQVISILTDSAYLQGLAKKTYLPTVLNFLNQGSADPYVDNFNKAALISKTWLDADQQKSKKVFGTMIDSIISGQRTINEAIREAAAQYDAVLSDSVQ